MKEVLIILCLIRRVNSVYHHRKWHVINFSSSQQQSSVCEFAGEDKWFP